MEYETNIIREPLTMNPQIAFSRLKSLPLALIATWPMAHETALAQSYNSPVLTTITNPTPAFAEDFGLSLAALGNDRVIIGAGGGNKAYLFALNGTLLSTFTSPDVGFEGRFGDTVASVGSDHVLCGDYYYRGSSLEQLGRAYLFSTNGTLLTTFTNPAPATTLTFGWAVAALGNDRAIISGFENINKPPPYPGSVYLFNTNGALLLTFTNPTPSNEGGFGAAIAAVAAGRVLIGAPDTGAAQSGVAYLFSTNGTLLNTIANPNPTPQGWFGQSVAVVGSDRLLISAINYGGTGGAAYLFDTNGTLISTFNNPNPAASGSGYYFGGPVAAVGSSRVLIGAFQDGTGAPQNGVPAYLFSTNGTLLNTITNPAPGSLDFFANSLAAVGSDRIIIGASGKKSGGVTQAGAAYLFALPYPPLSITKTSTAVSLQWVTPENGIVLQQSAQLNPAVWSNMPDPVFISGQTNIVQQTLVNSNRFFRLHRQ